MTMLQRVWRCWRKWLAVALVPAWMACGAEPPPPAASPTPVAESPEPAAPEPVPDEPPPAVDESRCAQDLSKELPVSDGEIGDGRRLVRVINNGTVELRVRLVDTRGKPVLPGTLRVPAGETGTFKVAAGSYVVRYRVESTCHVFEGSPVHLTGPRSGVEIGLKALFEEGTSHDVRRVDGDL